MKKIFIFVALLFFCVVPKAFADYQTINPANALSVNSVNATGAGGVATSTFTGAVSIAGTVIATNTEVCIPSMGTFCAFEVSSSTAADITAQKAADLLEGMGGGELDFGPGTFTFSNPLYLWSSSKGGYSNITIKGTGQGTTLVVPPGKDAMFGYDNKTIVASSSVGILIEDLHLDGSKMTNVDSWSEQAIGIKNSKNVTVRDVIMDNIEGFGIFVNSNSPDSATASSSNTTIDNVTIHAADVQDAIGGGPDNTANSSNSSTTDVVITNSHIYKYDVGGQDYNCIDHTGDLYLQISNTYCQGFIVLGNEANPNRFDSIDHSTVTSINGTTIAGGIVIDNSNAQAGNIPIGNSITDNTLQNANIQVLGTSNSTTTGGVISGNFVWPAPHTWSTYAGGSTTPAIYMSGASYIPITGNSLYGNNAAAGSYGIYETGVSNILAEANQIDGFNFGIRLSTLGNDTSFGNNFSNNTSNYDTTGGSTFADFNGSGFLGISTTTPNTTLDVNGDITDEKGSAYVNTGANTAIVCYTAGGKLGHMTITSVLASGNCVAN